VNITDTYARFIAIGDWGGLPVFPYRTLVEENVALYMQLLSEKSQVHFNMALGDNFYFNGITDVNDKRFNVGFVLFKQIIFKLVNR
jgi:tartrate-resistant acid phosphatase type 5